jgi:hypothetical protein
MTKKYRAWVKREYGAEIEFYEDEIEDYMGTPEQAIHFILEDGDFILYDEQIVSLKEIND